MNKLNNFVSGLIIAAILSTVLATILAMFGPREAKASQGSCACRELTRIRVLLEQQAGVVCNEYRCLPAPTPTAGSGEPLE